MSAAGDLNEMTERIRSLLDHWAVGLADVLKLTTGSIVELNRGVNEPVEVLVNHCLIARGEVVVVEGPRQEVEVLLKVHRIVLSSV